MTTYQFIKDYKDHQNYRLSFNKLANQTFGIDFEQWYQQGFWSEKYICYSYVNDEEVISNVSINLMELMIEGRHQKAIQIGTVMTEPAYRRQGLALQLMNKVFEDYDQVYEIYFLAADHEAVPLYEKCGFRPNEENQYKVDLTGYKRIQHPLKPTVLSTERMIDLKRKKKPLSTILSVVNDEWVLMFYYLSGYKHSIYQVQKDVYVIFEIEGDRLNLYDIFSPWKVDLQELIEKISPQHIHTVFLHFTPDQLLKNLEATIDSSSNWMIRSASDKVFPKNARFPKISQT